MYRRAVFTDEISQDLDVAVAMAREFRLDAVELRNVWGCRTDQLDDAALARVKDTLAEAGLKVAAISSPFFKATIDDEAEGREHLEILKRSIRAAKYLGTGVIRTFTFWKDRPIAADLYSTIIARYAEPIRIAQGEGVTLGIENESSTFVGTGQQLARFLAELDSPVVKAVWDPANAHHWEPREEAEQGFPVGYAALKPRIVHVHIKDYARSPETDKLEAVALGKGEVRIADQLRALVADGYAGYVSLETHYRPRKQLAEEITRLPTGEAFSELGAQGTAECLVNWEAML